MKQFKIVTLAQLIAWTLLTLGDYIEETFSSDVLLSLALLVIPPAIAILYLIFKGTIHNSEIPGWVNTLYILGMWIVETFIMRVLTIALVTHDRWIVHQETDGWENFLNGFEYLLFAFLLRTVPIIIIFLWYLLTLLRRALLQGTGEDE